MVTDIEVRRRPVGLGGGLIGEGAFVIHRAHRGDAVIVSPIRWGQVFIGCGGHKAAPGEREHLLQQLNQFRPRHQYAATNTMKPQSGMVSIARLPFPRLSRSNLLLDRAFWPRAATRHPPVLIHPAA